MSEGLIVLLFVILAIAGVGGFVYHVNSERAKIEKPKPKKKTVSRKKMERY